MATGLFNLKQVNQAISQGAWSGYIAPKWVEYLVVAGGGAGGTDRAGGGGGGGLLTGIVTVAAGTSYTVTVGAGGTTVAGNANPTGGNGNNSVFGSISSRAGGGGSGGDATTSASGGSGGGASTGGVGNLQGGQGTASQGNAGGTSGPHSGNYNAAGGGGAGTVGLNAAGTVSGNGGAGIASAISGTVNTYSGGGGGGTYGGTAGSGGVGGGGAGAAGTTAIAGSAGGGNTGGGGGGGGGANGAGGSGGSGIVVVRYPGSVQFFTGGTLSYANGYMIHTFYASGTLAPTTPTPYVTDYQISRSLRFNSADSAYLNRTPASAGNRTTWTFSAWLKRSKLGATGEIFTASTGSEIYFNTSDTLSFYENGGAVNLTTTQVFRDPSAWYHFVFAYDTTQATSSNRIKIYVNGTQITAFSASTYPTQNATSSFNSNTLHNIGEYFGGGAFYFDGYMTEVNFIDGQALTPSSFGYTNPATGVWSPLAFVGTYGTNGFYLNFSDNSNTTAATLGKDYSGNGNNWTPNNFSVTAGAGNDSLVDSPTSYGTDTGVGGTVRGNYATLNPLNAFGTSTFTNGNLDVSVSSLNTNNLATIAIPTSGKWYWEYQITAIGGGGSPMGGIASSSSNSPAIFYRSNGDKLVDGTSSSYGATYTTTDIIGVAVDTDGGTITFYKNGSSQGAVTYATSSGNFFPALRSNAATDNFTLNFGQRAFANTAPSGFKALCTQNLPTPTIGATASTLAGKFFAPVIYTPTSYPAVTTGVGFQPDFTWWKNRVRAEGNILFDVLRGSNLFLRSNTTAADDTQTNGWVANSDGWTSSSGSYTLNESYVAWNWKANGAGVTNTAGSITSTVSANTTSGFSVVTYTGTGSNATVGHGLGVAPKFIITKKRSSTSNWATNDPSQSNPWSGALLLNSTNAFASSSAVWNDTAPTTTVFSIGTADATNISSATYVAYCFAPIAGYSAFGSYTGNGSSDGAFVYTGFRPAYVLIKRTTSAYDWWILDAARGTINAVKGRLYANASDAESTTYPYLDFLSNGFKLRDADGGLNASGEPYIYACFAQNPFKYSLAR